MSTKRAEQDSLGDKGIPSTAFYGIHSLRAKENFPARERFHIEWYKSLGVVKLAAYQTVERFIEAVVEKYQTTDFPFYLPEKEVLTEMQNSAVIISEGGLYDHFIVPAITGGAGACQNMNINEIITNSALERMGHAPGDYNMIDPVKDAGIFQSANDMMPTALHVAILKQLKVLEEAVNNLRNEVEKKEQKYRNVLRLAYTQMQEAVPGSWGKLFSTYGDALSRDWWRVSKAYERIKVVNLGGSTTGTSTEVPRYYLMEVVATLQKLTGLPVTRGENLMDSTANHDSLVEVHAIIKALAVNLEKMVSDLRLLSSGISGKKTLAIPEVQMGSSIIPGRVNPVIPEYVISGAHKVYANDTIISEMAAQGCLELNAYLPLMGHSILDSLDILISACNMAAGKLVSGLVVDVEASENEVFYSPSVTNVLTPVIGYHNSSVLAKKMNDTKLDVFEANEEVEVIEQSRLRELMKPERLLQAGFVMSDIMKKR